MGVKIMTKQCNFTLLLPKTRGFRQRQFSICSKHIIVHIVTVNVRSVQCSPLALTHADRWWRHCCTAHARWYGLQTPHQQTVVNIVYILVIYLCNMKLIP